jgi:hypothetical protein
MKSRIYFLFLMIIISLCFIGFACADEKKIDVNVVVKENELIENSAESNYLNLNDIEAETGILNSLAGYQETGMNQKEINAFYQRRTRELASSKLSDNLFFPIILILAAIVLITTYFLRNRLKRRKKSKRKKHSKIQR